VCGVYVAAINATTSDVSVLICQYLNPLRVQLAVVAFFISIT
jgi:hypothetical protein